MPPRTVKSRTRPKVRLPSYLARGRSTARTTARKRRRAPLRTRVRTAPHAAPNVYRFTRGYDSFAQIGVTAGIFAMNTDNTFQVVNLKTKFNELPDFTEFNALFSEYKITSFSVKLVPTFKENKMVLLDPVTGGLASDQIPNYEVFAIPANYTDDEIDFSLKTGPQIDSYLNQTQRKSMSLMPNRQKTYVTARPKVVRYMGNSDKLLSATSTMAMGRPYWLSTAAPGVGFQDERNVDHYGLKLLIRRVDGTAMSSTAQSFGFRVHHQVNLLCRKVQ